MNYHRTKMIPALILTLLVVFAQCVARAQEEEEEYTSLKGTVLDVEKQPLEKAKIDLKSMTMGTVASATTNKKGEFFFPRLLTGKFEITVQKEGFKTYTGQIDVTSGSTPKIEIVLAKELTQEQKNAAEAVAAFKRGTEFFQQKNIEEALKEFEKAIELKPDFFEAYLNKGILLFQSMKDEEAEKSVLKALELKPDDVKAKEVLSNIYFEQSKTLLQNEKVDPALEKLKAVYNMQPNYPYLNFLLGYAYNKKNMKEDAIKHFELFLQQEPNAPQASQVKAILDELKKK